MKVIFFAVFIGFIKIVVIQAEPSPEKCNLYLAPSTTTHRKIGLFSTIEIAYNSPISEPELVINLVDKKRHMVTLDKSEDISRLLTTYWKSENMFMNETPDKMYFIFPTISCVSAVKSAVNSEFEYGNINIDGAEQSRENPHAGAYTEFHNVTLLSTRKIASGEEICTSPAANDDEDDDEDDDENDDGGEDYDDDDDTIDEDENNVAHDVVFQFADFLEKYDNLGLEEVYDMWFLFRNNEEDEEDMSDEEAVNVAHDAVCQFAEFLENHDNMAFEKLYDMWFFVRNELFKRRKKALVLLKLINVEDVSENCKNSGIFVRAGAGHPIEWLEKHGVCADNLTVGKSTTQGAGRGAFAKRSLKKGSVILLTPLVPIYDQEVLNMEKGKKQLILNYCFGHPHSSLLLHPTGITSNFINHKSSIDKEGPNVEIRWTTSVMNIFENDWLEMTVQELVDEHKDVTGQFFDVVATRDINHGEEVFLDYGKDWEEAWAKHVKNWTPPKDANGYVSALEMNEKRMETRYRTSEEQKEDPYPPNISIGYHIENEWVNKIYMCEVRNRRENEENEYFYTIFYDETEEEVLNVAHDEIKFYEKPYYSNQHLKEAFRHYIGVPDNIYPISWQNMREGRK